MKSFCYTLFGDGRKIAQIEQTSPYVCLVWCAHFATDPSALLIF